LSQCNADMSATTVTPEPCDVKDEEPSKPIEIVIADDHPIFRDGLKELLSREKDFHVIGEVGHGDDVLAAVEKHHPDILHRDLKMPGTHGLAVVQRMQTANAATKVIVLSGSDDKNDFVQAMKLGTCGIVLKQSPTDLLFKSIRKVYAGEIWLDSNTTAAVMGQFSSSDDYGRATVNGRTRERSPLRTTSRNRATDRSNGSA